MTTEHQNCILLERIKKRIAILKEEDYDDFLHVKELGKKLNWTDEDIKRNHESENWRQSLIKELELLLNV